MKKLLPLPAVLFLLLIVILGCLPSANASKQKFAALGDFKLESGEVIKDCTISYRTYGILNSQKSNAVLVLTWLVGTTEDLDSLGYIGEGKMIDTSRHYVVAVDALGNGVSSSPSNSITQPFGAFPAFTIRDMVRTQHELLVKHLGISGIFAVAGISMGGMQAFEWAVMYPTFMEKAVSINATPWVTSADILAFSAEIAVIDLGIKGKSSNEEIMNALTPLHSMISWTPSFRAANTKPDETDDFIAQTQKLFLKYNAFDWKWQLKAIKTHNILKSFGGSKEKAASAVKSGFLVVTSARDYCVYQEPSKSFAQMLKARTVELSGDCGHFSFLCEQNKLSSEVNAFLNGAK